MANPLFDALFGQHLENDSVFLQMPCGTTWTYRAFLKLAAQYAGQFSAIGLKPGDRVAVQIAKSPQALAVYAACAQTGLVFLPLNTAYTAAEVAYFIENSGAGIVLCDDTTLAELTPIAASCGSLIETLNADGSGSFAQKAALQSETFQTVPRHAHDLAAFLYTSGTTGRSKGAMLCRFFTHTACLWRPTSRFLPGGV